MADRTDTGKSSGNETPDFQGQWQQMLGRAKEQWGRLAHDDLARMEGRREELIGKIRQAYGLSQEEAEQQVAQFERDMAEQKGSGRGSA